MHPTIATTQLISDETVASISEDDTPHQRLYALSRSVPLSGVSGHKKDQRLPSLMKKWITAFWQGTREDLTSLTWRNTSTFICFRILPFATIGILMALMIAMPTRYSSRLTGICRPDGTVNRDHQGYNPWRLSEMFTINLAYGRFPFEQAKMIDISWDLIIGRGCQAIMAVVSYRVLSSSLSYLMESRPISLGTFEAIMLQDGTLKALLKLTRDFRKNTTAKSKLVILTMMLVAICVLVFPTLVSAMTGYTSVFDTEVKLSNGTSVLANQMFRVFYIIHDGSRLGPDFHDNYLVVDPGTSDPDESPLYSERFYRSRYDALNWERSRSKWMQSCSATAPGTVDSINGTISLKQEPGSRIGSDCDLLWEISRYTYTYRDVKSVWMNSTFGKIYNNTETVVPGPPLNITPLMPNFMATYWSLLENMFSSDDLAWAVVPYGVPGVNIGLLRSLRTMPQDNQEKTVDFFAEPKTQPPQAMSLAYLASNVHCQQRGPGGDSLVLYQWGFALQQLFICAILLLLWMICLYGLSMHTFYHTRPRLYSRSLGLRRAILDIAPRYQEHIGSQDVTMHGDKQLQKIMYKGTISYENVIMFTRNTMRRESARTWVRQEWIWLMILTTMSVLWLLSTAYMLGDRATAYWSEETWSVIRTIIWTYWDPCIALIPIFGAVIVLCIDRSRTGRWVWFVLTIIIYAATLPAWLAHQFY